MRVITLTTHVADQLAAVEAAARRRRQRLRLLARCLLVILPPLALGLALAGQTRPALAIGSLGAMLLLLLGVALVANPGGRDLAIKRAGLAGEHVLPRLLAELPDSYVLLNGVPLAGVRADIDHVLVGPGGVWAIEVKHHAGVVQCVGDAWGYARIGRDGLPRAGQIGNPSRQAQRAATALTRLLGEHGIEHAAQALVVFTHPLVELHLSAPATPVLRATEVVPLVRRAPARLTPRQVRRIVAALCRPQGVPA